MNIQKNQKGIKDFFEGPQIKEKIKELVGDNSSAFTTSILQIVNSSEMLKDATPVSVFSAACMAATLNLPINNSLGYAHIVPFRNKKDGITEAQFQLGYKGFVQLAQRSGQFKILSSAIVHEGQLIEADPLQGYKFNWNITGGNIIGYVAYFKLLNGFEAYLYMTYAELNSHAKKYSQAFKKGYGVWADNFDAMALKTVTKLLLSKQAPLSIEMQTAIIADQAVIDKQDFDYIDNKSVLIENKLPECTEEKMKEYKKNIADGSDPETILAMASTKYLLTKEQCEEIRNSKELK